MHLSSPLVSARLAIDIDQPGQARPHSGWGYSGLCRGCASLWLRLSGCGVAVFAAQYAGTVCVGYCLGLVRMACSLPQMRARSRPASCSLKIGRGASRTACDAERRTIVDKQKGFLPRYH
ncbi:DUF1534 domain-containing protein [Pseudomonas syringae pv. maculicola str. ES4326]|uniref:DUF1534 domain-containing protein n=1 Tax=Pseudomonas syringae pv. maculicola str. ES4326 TaxID=629265 RepID=A0A8T8C1T3_PSEYM|nr:DUF1534 domain-containing protein [Pseudomonas syringae pv. maculicola str. ES4326]